MNKEKIMSITSNLETLLAAVEAQPEDNFDLSHFRQDTACGTNFCTLGLACTMPKFREMGFSLREELNTFAPSGFSYHAQVNGLSAMWGNRTDFAFGTNSYERLFEPADDGNLDEELGYEFDYDTDTANMSDKELAIARLKKQIELMKGE